MLAAFLLALAAPAPAGCSMTEADRRWIDGALANWRVVERTLLKLAPTSLPAVIAIDARCSYRRTASGWQGAAHQGQSVHFPDGKSAPIGPLSFTAPQGGGSAYFAMSLPSVWRAAGVTSELGLERLMDGVLLHELMHTRQAYFANATLDRLSEASGLGHGLDDDALQGRFTSDAAYVAAYQTERDRLFAAAAAPTDADARRLAREALTAMRERRARWFTGSDAFWAEADDVFLLMEGLGQWLAYRWYCSPEGGAVAPAAALEAVRRKGRWWSQDEGLALMLTIDRLLPGWQGPAFAARPALAEALLAMAAAEAPTQALSPRPAVTVR